MTEEQFLARLIDLCESSGYLYHHCMDGRKCMGPGFPDLVIASTSGLVFIETKKNSFSKVSKAQVTWRHTLKASGQVMEMFTIAELGVALDLIEAELS